MDEFIGECEICGRCPHGLRVVVVTGLDTFACHECLGDDHDAEIDDALDSDSLVEATDVDAATGCADDHGELGKAIQALAQMTDRDRAIWLSDRAGLRRSPERLAWIAVCIEILVACRREGMEAVYANR